MEIATEGSDSLARPVEGEEIYPKKTRGLSLKPTELMTGMEKGLVNTDERGIVDCVVLFGSTSSVATWREGVNGQPGVEKKLNDLGITTVNPKDPNYSHSAEAYAMNHGEFLAFFGQNGANTEHPVIGGSRGTMIEIDKVWIALLRGQSVVIGLEPGFASTIRGDLDAERQYAILQQNLQEMKRLVPEKIKVYEECSSDDFFEHIVEAYNKRKESKAASLPITASELKDIDLQRQARLGKNGPRDVVVFGSSSSFGQADKTAFMEEQVALRVMVANPDNKLHILYEGEIANKWLVVENLSEEERKVAIAKLLHEEKAFKENADIAVITVSDKALSTGVVAEIGKQIYISTLKKLPDGSDNPSYGQQVIVLLEPFIVDKILQTVLTQHDPTPLN